jgi:hypothetical protein
MAVVLAEGQSLNGPSYYCTKKDNPLSVLLSLRIALWSDLIFRFDTRDGYPRSELMASR